MEKNEYENSVKNIKDQLTLVNNRAISLVKEEFHLLKAKVNALKNSINLNNSEEKDVIKETEKVDDIINIATDKFKNVIADLESTQNQIDNLSTYYNAGTMNEQVAMILSKINSTVENVASEVNA